jgi:hypothetical protein
MMGGGESDERRIALRAYCVPAKRKEDERSAAERDDKKGGAPWGPSPHCVILDSETSTGAEQRLRVGCYQARFGGVLREEGLYYDPTALNRRERRRLRDYARRHELRLLMVDEFNEQIIYRLAYLRNALIVGFNLGFDAARLAYHHEAARGRKMSGGFSLTLVENWPHLRVKHLSRTAALHDFAAPGGQRSSRSQRRRGRPRRVRRGFFCDVHSLAAALVGGSQSLASLALLRDTPHKKIEAEHGQELNAKYIRYVRNDVQVTWECYASLAGEYERFGLSQTPVSRILSEASIGKACLREMGVRPWREVQPEGSQS